MNVLTPSKPFLGHKQNFELDESQITKLANTTASDFQPSQGNQPARKKPSWMKTTHAPEVATEPTHNTGGFDAYRHSSDEKGTEEGRGEGTTHVPTRTSAGFASQTAEREVSSNATLSSSIQPFLNYLIVRSSAEASEWRQARLAASDRPQMTPQQHHSGAERPSTFAVNYAGLQQHELTGSAALKKRQFAAASRTQGGEEGVLNRVLQSLCYLTEAVVDLKDANAKLNFKLKSKLMNIVKQAQRRRP
ncbi:MAG: hypothetical protein FRX49_04490 [Trebouxia sp. A1-2]|nr:MAG: hypothetical protein FRX49_04490 [Trebouxia sp. A1-2]